MLQETSSFVQQIKMKQEEQKKIIFHSQMTSPNQTREHTPNQRKAKIESDNSCSPTLFRTPQISLHYDRKRTHQRQPSNNRSRNENMSNIKYNVDSAAKDYSKVLDEVMKKYRQLQQELNTKDKEIQKTRFYKEEWLKEKKRNEILVERNAKLKIKLLKVIELVQQDQLQQNDESESIIANLATENTQLRKMLNIYDVEVQEEDVEMPQDADYIDSILNVFLSDLKLIESKKKEKKDNQFLGQCNSLSLTVLNKESSFVDLSEDKLLMEQQQQQQQ